MKIGVEGDERVLEVRAYVSKAEDGLTAWRGGIQCGAAIRPGSTQINLVVEHRLAIWM
jgi:hypothetical protein